MTQVAVQIPHRGPDLHVIAGSKSTGLFGIKKEVLYLGAFLAILQVLDGILTALGVINFGTDAEGNMLLRALMEQVGHIPALFIAKSLAIVVVGALCVLSNQIKWVGRAFRIVIGIYLVFAIIPWTMIMVTKAFAS